MYYITPLFTFWTTCMNLTFMGNEATEQALFKVNDREATVSLALYVLSYQFIFVFLLTLLVDYCIMNRYKKRGGKFGNKPPHLPVEDNVKEHEE